MSSRTICGSCKKAVTHSKRAFVGGRYYKIICLNCLGQSDNDFSGGSASYERRRGYEDNAQYTIQPYDANGKPRVEFYRLYPEAALKVFGKEKVEELKRHI